jgi:pimeloyl-ACP methyl ester carboxylesterase
VFVHGFLVDDALWADVPERLGRRGFRAFAPTWPLASHTAAMKPDADLSPRGVARVVLGFLARLDLRRLASVFRDARLVEVPNAAAFISLDQPARLADEIAAFAA